MNGRPGKPKQTDRDEPCQHDEMGQTRLRLGPETIYKSTMDRIDVGRPNCGQSHADTNAQEGQACDTRRPVARLFVDDRICRKIEI